MNNLDVLIACARQIFEDKEHYTQARGAFYERIDTTCGVCYMGAAYLGCQGSHYRSSGMLDIDSDRLSVIFDIPAKAIWEIINMNDIQHMTWEQIEEKIKTPEWRARYYVPNS